MELYLEEIAETPEEACERLQASNEDLMTLLRQRDRVIQFLANSVALLVQLDKAYADKLHAVRLNNATDFIRADKHIRLVLEQASTALELAKDQGFAPQEQNDEQPNG